MITPLTTPTLPRGIRSRFVDGINGLTMHVLEAGFEAKGRPCVLLLHGFPGARLQLAQGDAAAGGAGFHVIAPDQRGYGRTTGWDGDYDGDLGSFRMLNLVRDVLGLRLGARLSLGGGRDRARLRLAGGGVVRAGAARRVPLGGADERAVRRSAALPFDTARSGAARRVDRAQHPRRAGARSTPPRKHYQWYYSTRAADDNMRKCAAGRARLPARLLPLQERRLEREQALSARRPGRPASWRSCRPTTSWSSTRGWPRRVAPEMPSAAEIAACKWLTDDGARRLQRGVRAHRLPGRAATGIACRTAAGSTPSCEVFSGRTIDVPSTASSRARATGASTRRRARSSGCRRAPARTCWAAIWWTAPGTGCSRSSPRPPPRLLLEFLRAAGTLR